MKCRNYSLIALALGLVISLTGCSESRTHSAQHRFDRVLEQARIDTAIESIEQGRLQYAIRILEDLVESGSAFSDQAKVILKDLRIATQRFTVARNVN